MFIARRDFLHHDFLRSLCSRGGRMSPPLRDFRKVGGGSSLV
jgi:hypothetical protein